MSQRVTLVPCAAPDGLKDHGRAQGPARFVVQFSWIERSSPRLEDGRAGAALGIGRDGISMRGADLGAARDASPCTDGIIGAALRGACGIGAVPIEWARRDAGICAACGCSMPPWRTTGRGRSALREEPIRVAPRSSCRAEGVLLRKGSLRIVGLRVWVRVGRPR